MSRYLVVVGVLAALSSCGEVGSFEQAIGGEAQPRFPDGAELVFTELTPTSVTLAWPAATHPSGMVAYRLLRDGEVVIDELEATTFSITDLEPATSYCFAVVALGPGVLESANRLMLMLATPPDTPPVDPGPPGDTDLADQLEPFYIGPDAPQIGVDPEAIDPVRLAAVRGRVTDPDLTPLEGVRIGVRHHPELGHTLTDAAGEYTMVVNGGGELALDYDLAGYLPAQREALAVWRDIVWTDPVVLVSSAASPRSTITANAAVVQRITGAQVTDADGTRRAVALIPPGTSMTLVHADGTSEPLGSDDFSITEYTVGPNAAAFQAEGAGPDDQIHFSQTVPIYVDNFTDFPVGEELPSGFYDRDRAEWIPVQNGRILAIVGASGGLAEIDATGDGIAETGNELAAFGITFDERAELALIYPEPTTIWRMPVDHFTSYDFNGGLYLPGDATFPEGDPRHNRLGDKPCEQGGSIIECQDQVIAEEIAVAASGFSLHYTSATAFGRTENRTITIPVSGSAVPDSCELIWVQISIAGQRHEQTTPCEPNAEIAFVWNGFDAWGNRVQGERDALVRVGYQYGGVGRYGPARELGAKTNTGTAWQTGASGSEITFRSALGAFILWAPRQRVRIGSLMILPENSVGGWTLTPHHRRDRSGRRIYYGDGTRTSLAGGRATIERIEEPINTFGGAVAVAPSGAIYFTAGRQIFVRDREGTTALFAGRLHDGEACVGDVDDPLQAEFGSIAGGRRDILDLAVRSDGSLYVNDGARIQRIHPDGRVRWIAAHPNCGPDLPDGVTSLGDAGAATSDGIALDPTGGIYTFARLSIRRISPSGDLQNIGFRCSPSNFVGIRDADVGPDGNVYVGCGTAGIARIKPDGEAEFVVRTSTTFGASALEAADDGSIYFVNSSGGFVSAIDRWDPQVEDPSGETLERVAGDLSFQDTDPYDGSDGDALTARLSSIRRIAVHPDGSILTLNTRNEILRRINTGLGEVPVNRNGNIFAGVPSETGGQLFVFDTENRHRETIDSATGATIFSFAYDGEGRLLGIDDVFGNHVAIARDTAGVPQSIVAPFGQTTAIELDTEGYLSRAINPEQEMVSPTFTAEGLITELVDPLGRLHHFEYDDRGRLILDQLPQGEKRLTREEVGSRSVVTVTTALGRESVYTTEPLGTGSCPTPGIGSCIYTSVLDPAGTLVESFEFRNGTRIVFPGDGSKFVIKAGLDPRFRFASPRVRAVDVTLANGAVVSSAYDYQVDLSDPNNTLSVTRLERTSTVNGRASRSVYDVPGRNITATSPEGRQSVVTLDANSRIVREETPGILPLDYEYDARGRLARVVQGDRETINDFDPTSGFLARVQTRRDATEFLTSTFSRDAIGRTTTSVDPDGAISNFEYDDGGNLLAINPPESGDRVHELSYGPLDQLTGYAPPEDPDNRDETYEYNDDNQLARHVAADGTEHTSAYQSSGLLSSLAVDGATWFTTAYQPDGLHNPIEITQAGVELGRPPATASFTYDGPEVASTRWAVAGVDRGIVAYDTSAFHSARTVVETVNGSPVVYQYDDDGLLVSAGGVAITRDPLNGRAVGITVGNVAETIGYEPHGAEDLSVVSFAGAELFRAELSHDLLGRVDAQSTAIDGVLQSRAYVYDLAGRLVEVRDGSGTVIEAYTVDARGNRLSAIGVDPTTVAYDFDDRILAYGDLSFEYNGRGDVTEIFGPSGTTTITYADTATTPHRIATAAGDVVTFEIGPSGSVLTRAVNGTATDEYLWGQSGRPALHTDPRTGVATRFVYAERSTVPTQMIRGGQSYALVTDVRGSVRLVVRASDGAVMQRLDYDSFGQVLSDTNPGFQPFGFGGGLYDPVTGFVHLGQRIYDPRLGRFLSVDPAGLGDGVNRYIYAGGDPINFVDPTGLGAIEYIEGGLEAFVGFGDHLTLGVSRRLRHAVGLGDVINECSGWYRGGQFVGEVLDYIGLATLAYGVLRWGLKGIAGRFARGRVERSGGFGKWTDPETLGSYSGRTAVERNRALDAVIAEDFASLNFTFKPQYSPYAGYGISSRNLGTQIGPKAFGSRAQLRDTIVHEELHHRWWRRGITARHHVAGSAMEQRFYKTVERYKRIRGW